MEPNPVGVLSYNIARPNLTNRNRVSENQNNEGFVVDLGSIDTQNLLKEEHSTIHKPIHYVNKLSSREMESLAALCDTLLPAMEPPSHVDDENVARFYRTSPTMNGTPEYLGGLISERLKHHVFLLRFLFWILSTRIGTFFMAGFSSISTSFPFFHKFSQLPLEKRQQIVASWATSWLFLYGMAFVGTKLLVTYSFFSQVDEKGDNPSWKGIGYDGPDPKTKSKMPNSSNHGPSCLTTKPTQGPIKTQYQPIEDLYGPLHKGVISPTRTWLNESLLDSLQRRGFNVSRDRRTIQCDVVIVGSGSGGGVAAGVLALAGYKVLVLEKGGYYARSNLSLLEGPTLDKMYEGAGMLATRDMGVTIMAGSTVGGGSTINWSASIKTPDHVIRDWAHVHELEIFESPMYKEALDVVCRKMKVQNDVPVEEGLNNMVLRKGCLKLGYPIEDIPRNSCSDHSCGWCGFGCKDGKKKGVSENWLKDVLDSGNGLILSGCEVVKVVKKNGNGRKDIATGVIFNRDGDTEPYYIEAKATVVSCGALNTPTLLKKSGLKNPNIGKHLHLHPVVMAWGYFPEGDVTCGGSYEGGIMTTMSRTEHNSIIQTPSFHPGVFAALIPWTSSADFKRRMTRFSRTAHIFSLVRDVGPGTIVSSPTSFDITYKMDPSDESSHKKGVGMLLTILAAAGAEEVGTHQFDGASINVKNASSDEFERFVKSESSKGIKPQKTIVASAHQMGSCRMGVDPKRSVVNHKGETWEVEGLYLADSSVFPTALGVNPMVTVQAIAYCTAQSVIESLKRKKK